MAHKKDKKSKSSVGFEVNIKKYALENEFFHRVVFTGKHSQLAAVKLSKGEKTYEGREGADTMVFIVKGKGKLVLSGRGRDISKHDFIFVPEGEAYRLINVGRNDLKAIVVYSPPIVSDGTVQDTPRELTAEKELALERAWEQ